MPELPPPAQKLPAPSAAPERMVDPENCVVVAFNIKVPLALTDPTARGTGVPPLVLDESMAELTAPTATL